MERACDNCAIPDDELVLVRRVYVSPERWDTSASEQVVESPELWCVSCVSQYPHRAVEDPGVIDEDGQDEEHELR